jgi:hypothetical protein
MDRKDWNLLTLSAAGGGSISPAQLQKVLFLLQTAFPEAVGQGYIFRPYHYGPFDADVYCDAESLEAEGLVQIRRASGGWKEFSPTPQGLQRAEALERQADPHATAYLRQLVTWARSLSFADLVRSIYSAYPEMRVRSIFKDAK